MRYKVIAKQYKPPGHYIVMLDTEQITRLDAERVEKGRIIRVPPEATGRALSPGETGRLMQGERRQHFRPDAIEGDYVEV